MITIVTIISLFIFPFQSRADLTTEELLKHEKKVLAEAKSRAEKKAPYWLRDIEESGDFKIRSLEMAKKLAELDVSQNSPFCIAVFVNSPRGGKGATFHCLQVTTTNGYNSRCEIAEGSLGTGKYSYRQIGPKCDSDSATRAMRVSPANLFLQSDYFEGGFPGDLGIYIHRDDFGTIKNWLASWGEVNKTRLALEQTNKEKKKKSQEAAEKKERAKKEAAKIASEHEERISRLLKEESEIKANGASASSEPEKNGTLEVEVHQPSGLPLGVKIYTNGVFRDRSPAKIALPEGSHILKLYSPSGSGASIERVEIKAGKTTTIRKTLSPLPENLMKLFENSLL